MVVSDFATITSGWFTSFKSPVSCPLFALRLTPVRGSGASEVYAEDFLSGASLLRNRGNYQFLSGPDH
jgi:hypothetical protein